MTTTVVERPTFTAAQWLLDHSRGQGMVVSCYADMSVAGTRPLWRKHLAHALQQIEPILSADPAARRALDRDLDTVLAALSAPAAKAARGMAVFASAGRNLARAFPLDTPVTDRLVVDEELYILPLLEYLHRQRRYLVVHTDSRHGLLYEAGRGPMRLIEEISENIPRRHGAAGELWGKQQATIARHREDHQLHYRKELVRQIERTWADGRYEGLILLGEHVVLERLRKALPDHLARHVVHAAAHPFAGRTMRLDVKVRHVVTEAMREHDRRVAEQVRTRLADRRGVAIGAQETIDAIRNSQVNWPGYVVMTPDDGRPGWLCPGCGSIFDHAHGPCPYCHAACQKVNLWQEIALLASRHGIPVHFVAHEPGLDACGGIIAVLTREHPWEAPPSPAATTPATTG
jgi:rubrerythrin